MTKKTIEISEKLLNSTNEELANEEHCMICDEELCHDDKLGYIDGLCLYCQKEELRDRQEIDQY